MIILSLCTGIIIAIISAIAAYNLEVGILGICLAYILGGVLGMTVFHITAFMHAHITRPAHEAILETARNSHLVTDRLTER